MNARSGQLKNEGKSELFSVPGDAKESAKGTTTNAFEVHLMIKNSVHLMIHLELHLEMYFKIFIKMQKKVYLKLHWTEHFSYTCASDCTKWFNKMWNWGTNLCRTWKRI